MRDAKREVEWLQRACELSHQLVEEPDARRLLPLILDSAIELTNAERGFLVRVDEETSSLRVALARGFDGESIQARSGAVSRRLVELVAETGDGVATTREEDQDLLNLTSLREKHVLAILCVPMTLRGATVGVIYLDHRFLDDPFRAEDLEPLQLLADQAALAWELAELDAQRRASEEQLERARGQLHEQERERERKEQRRRRLLGDQRAATAGELQGLGELIGRAPATCLLFEALERASRTTQPLLVTGPIGSGKSAATREVHRRSGRAGPLVVVHSLATAAAELGPLLERARGGSLVLEGVEDASADLQAALVLELREPRGPESARLMATGSEGLEQRLRPDLFFRLNVLRAECPPLRDRTGDLPLLLGHAWNGQPKLQLTPNALQSLVDYGWPGNLVELQSLVARLQGLGKKITTRDLPAEVRDWAASAGTSEEARTIAEMELRMAREALAACGGNKAQAARRLGIQRSTLYRILARGGAPPPENDEP